MATCTSGHKGRLTRLPEKGCARERRWCCWVACAETWQAEWDKPRGQDEQLLPLASRRENQKRKAHLWPEVWLAPCCAQGSAVHSFANGENGNLNSPKQINVGWFSRPDWDAAAKLNDPGDWHSGSSGHLWNIHNVFLLSFKWSLWLAVFWWCVVSTLVVGFYRTMKDVPHFHGWCVSFTWIKMRQEWLP